ncbi:MAG: permease-like cell division protein FtsX [Desulfobacterales bacterium]|nr:permease-like cell division protein FtsX [Desulfobacterales bacterium]MDX2512512.1 permease-like cell division protein FtsX [Desulfobacterales bacterium]
MITLFLKKALQDILGNRFLNSVTIVTIGLSVLIVSSFALFFINTNALLDSWRKGIRVLVYLEPQATEAKRLDLRYQIQQLENVQEIHFISKVTALKRLKDQMRHHSSLLENLKQNPLPDTFEVRIIDASRDLEKVAALAEEIKSLPQVEEVEYGQHWIAKFSHIINIFKFIGYAMGGLFLIATLFIIANTIRLVLYSRKEEIEIMRLVGSNDRFIKAPLYIEGLILSALGGIIGLVALFAVYQFVLSKFHASLSLGLLEIKFLSIGQFFLFVGGSMLVGWIGCYLSLKQFLKN